MNDETIDFSGRKIHIKDIYSISFAIEERRLIGIIPLTRHTVSITFESGRNKHSTLVDGISELSKSHDSLYDISKTSVNPHLYISTLQEWINGDATEWLMAIHNLVLNKKNSYRIFQLEDGKITRFGYIYE